MTGAPPFALVIDTNRVLDLWLFDDPAVDTVRAQICGGQARWLATAAMRAELAEVLNYPGLVRQLQRRGRAADAVLAAFDRWARPADPAPPAPVRCRDGDDQIFVDLAVHWRATLLSKDHEVCVLAPRLAPLGVVVC